MAGPDKTKKLDNERKAESAQPQSEVGNADIIGIAKELATGAIDATEDMAASALIGNYNEQYPRNLSIGKEKDRKKLLDLTVDGLSSLDQEMVLANLAKNAKQHPQHFKLMIHVAKKMGGKAIESAKKTLKENKEQINFIDKSDGGIGIEMVLFYINSVNEPRGVEKLAEMGDEGLELLAHMINEGRVSEIGLDAAEAALEKVNHYEPENANVDKVIEAINKTGKLNYELSKDTLGSYFPDDQWGTRNWSKYDKK